MRDVSALPKLSLLPTKVKVGRAAARDGAELNPSGLGILAPDRKGTSASIVCLTDLEVREIPKVAWMVSCS